MSSKASRDWNSGLTGTAAGRITDMRRAGASRSRMTESGPERIGRGTPKPVAERYLHCRLKVRCAGSELEPMRRIMGICQHCARYMSAVKPQAMSIGEWLQRRSASRSPSD